jgi:acetyl esterase/lipase
MRPLRKLPLVPLIATAAVAAIVLGLVIAALNTPASMLWMFRPVKVVRDLCYSNDNLKSHMLDLYLPWQLFGKRLPVVVFVHGGAWVEGDKAVTAADFLARQGFAVASVNYRLASEAPYPAQLQDVTQAIDWLGKEANCYGLDADQMGLWGISTGGQIAALVALTPRATGNSHIKAVCDICGPADLEKLDGAKILEKTWHGQPAINLFLGGPMRERLQLARQASPINFCHAWAPPFLIIHGDKDDVVPVSQSIALAVALQDAGARCHFFIVKDGKHDCFNRVTLERIVEFFNHFLRRWAT